MCPPLAAATRDSIATATVTSPPAQMASTPRPTTALAASDTPAGESTVTSISSIPSSLHMLRAMTVAASELASDGFHTTPTLFRFGFASRAKRNNLSTGWSEPYPVIYGGWSFGFSRLTPTPELQGSEVTVNTSV